MPNKILILFAHPAQDHSEVNLPMFNAAKKIEHVTCVDLYALYPNHDIDVDIEQDRLRQHDIVIFLFPLYWYSTPAILKDWMDLVLEYGFAYGKAGTALEGKTLLPVISAGGAEKAYQDDGYNHFSIRELLRPLEQTAKFCKMQFMAPFIIFGARTAVEEERLLHHLEKWTLLLDSLIHDRLDTDKAQVVEHLLNDFEEIVR